MKYLLVVFFILMGTIVTAQPKLEVQSSDTWFVRFNPFGLIDPLDGNLSAGLEFSLNNRWSVTTDLSFIAYSTYVSDNSRTLGYIFKPALRYYTSDKRNFFLETAVFYKRAGYKITDWLGKACVNGVPAYEEFQSFVYRKRVAGINLQAGWQRSLTRNKRLRMEIYAGFGVRLKWLDVKNEPMACYEPDNIFIGTNNFNEPRQALPSIPHGLRLIYSLRQHASFLR